MADIAASQDTDTQGAVEWSPVRRVNVSEEIADQLISRILQGQLKFGDKLPAERDLARMLNVGRPSLREAIRTLSVIGLVEVRPGEGTFIVDRHADFVAKAFSWTLLLDTRTAVELVDVRAAIECQQARLAARRATAEDIAELQDLLGKMERAADREQFFHVDLDFHLALSKIAANIALERLMVSSRSLLRQWILIANKWEDDSVAAQLNLQHRQIVDAIERHDETAADAAMRLHVEAVSRSIANVAGADARPDLKDSAQRGRFGDWPWETIR